MYERLLVNRDGDVMRVAFNNARLSNAMDGKLLQEMVGLCRELDQDAETRFVVFTGLGESFMAGIDLKSDDMSVGDNPDSARRRQRIGQELVKHLRDLEQVTFAAVNGSCIGAGLAVAIACDLRVASEDSVWALPNTSLGYFFSWACTPLLVSLVGPGNAKDLILARRELTAPEALQMNLANMTVPGDQLLEAVDGMINRIRDGGPVAMRMAKKLVNASSPAGCGDGSTVEPEAIERLSSVGESPEDCETVLENHSVPWR